MDRYWVGEVLAVYVAFLLITTWNYGDDSPGDQGVVQAVSVDEDLSLTREQKEALDKFKDQVLPLLPHIYMKQEIYLIRWLRARDFHVGGAEEMLKDHLEWREREKMDTIRSEDWSDLRVDFPYTNDTEDKEGRPVLTIHMGAWNIRRMAVTGQMPRLQRYYAMLLEDEKHRVIQKQKRGERVTQWKMLVNLEGFTMMHQGCAMCLSAYVGFIRTHEEHFPGQADKIININAPPIYEIVLNLIRPLFSPMMQKATVYYGEDNTTWMNYLDGEISTDQRRKEYGGTLKNNF